MTEYAFYYFDLVRLYAEVFETNKASMRVGWKRMVITWKASGAKPFSKMVLMDDYIWVKLKTG